MRREKHSADQTPEDGPGAAAPTPDSREPADPVTAGAETGAAEVSPVEEETEGPDQRDLQIADLRASIADLEARLDEQTRRAEQEHNQALRSLADFQNYRRRGEEQRREAQQFANQEFVYGLLPILDNFERALAAAEANRSYEGLVEGVRLTMRQLQDYLKKLGVEPIEALGKEFDPNYHEAVMRVVDPEQPENAVVEELQRGYMLHARVLRPSMVKVARSE